MLGFQKVSPYGKETAPTEVQYWKLQSHFDTQQINLVINKAEGLRC